MTTTAISIESDAATNIESNAAERWPRWFKSYMGDYAARFKGYEPYPFAQPSDSSSHLSLHQNDYLRLSKHPEVVAAKNTADASSGGGPMASIIYGGDSGEHQRFRDLIARSMRAQDVLLTTAGWTANVGVIEAVARPHMPVYLDYEAHASLWDGAKLAGAKVIPAPHNEPDELLRRVKRHGPGVVCIDAYYSTDGSVPDLARYVDICDEHECLLVLDEAHSFGMTGANGGGLAVELGLEDRIPVRTVSMSKALGGNGGFIAGSEKFIWFLRHRVRSTIFSSSPTPAGSAGGHAALQVAMREPHRARQCLAMAAQLRGLLAKRAICTGASNSQIVSLCFDEDQQTCRFYGLMRKRGILVSVFVSPAVPLGTGLARFSIHCDTREADMIRVADAAEECLAEMSVHSRVGLPFLQ